jgi:DNA repair ATPase RecN
MMNAEILGFSVIDSGPVGAVHLPYHQGLSVLYGQNGAGKSYVLRGVTSALSGIRPAAGRAFVHVRVDDEYWRDDELDVEPDVSPRR